MKKKELQEMQARQQLHEAQEREAAARHQQQQPDSDLNNADTLENFDFENFLQTADFNFDPSIFEADDGTRS